MRMPRIFSPEPLHSGAAIRLDQNAARHLLQVPRLPAGESLILFDGSGQDFAAQLLAADKRDCIARVGQVVASEQPPALKVYLAIGISRGERMDYAIQKAVELGAWSITPLFTGRTVVRLKGKRLESREAHWLGVIRHACEQSGRSLLPALGPATSLDEWLGGFHGPGLLLDHRADTSLRQLPAPGERIQLLVGPEGGLSDAERKTAIRHGLQPVRLGPRILRTETAPSPPLQRSRRYGEISIDLQELCPLAARMRPSSLRRTWMYQCRERQDAESDQSVNGQ